MPTGDKPVTRVLAIDFGDKRTGMAGTDFTGTIASPLEILHQPDQVQLVGAIARIAEERESQLILIGMPLAPDGGLGARGEKTLAFARKLARALAPLPVMGLDERNTTSGAHEKLKSAGMRAAQRKKKGVDAISALLLIEAWLHGEKAVDLESFNTV